MLWAGGLSLRAQLGHDPSAGSRPSVSAMPSDLKLTDASFSAVFVRLQCCVPLNPPECGEGVQDVMGQLL